MTASKLVLNAASGAGGGATLDVDDVFSTFLYEGDASSRSITNGIDLSGEGGLVWIKAREIGYNSQIYDTARGATYYMETTGTNASVAESNGLTAFNSNGFSIGNDAPLNTNNSDYVSWTFRKAPKFFDVVTYTGNATVRTIAHNLGSTPGMIIIKKTSGTGPWYVFHRNSTDTDGKIGLQLNQSDAQGDFGNTHWDVSEMSSTHFGLGNMGNMNGSGNTYVAYLFAHNNNDGEFGPDSDQDIIKCDYFETSTGGSRRDINLGFEPQFVLLKNVTNTTSGDWWIMDDMRQMLAPNGDDTAYIRANSGSAEGAFGGDTFMKTSTGFAVVNNAFATNSRFVYMAIRKGPLAKPTDATKFFQAHAYSGDGSTRKYNLNITPDMVINLNRGGVGDARAINSRLIGSGKEMYTDQTGTEYAAGSAGMQFDYTNAIEVQNYRDTNGSTYLNLCWKRAPGYFDIVAYTGNDTAGRTVTHNLGAVPEMMWVKRRDGASRPWYVYHKNLDTSNPAHKYLQLNETSGVADSTGFWNDTAPTSSVFTVGDDNGINGNTSEYVAYLFATLAGVSKVGSFTATGNTINVDCGFSNGAAFILMKRVDSTTFGWAVWDSTRGIVSGNDPYSLINDTSVEVTNTDYVDPLSSGFTVSNNFYSAGTWIFYAIAA